MAKADPPKKKKSSGGLAATVVGTTALKGAGEGIARGLKPYNTETTWYKNKVPRTFYYNTVEGKTAAGMETAIQRVTKTKAYSKLGVKTTSTLTETLGGVRQSTRSTTLSPRGKLKGLGQVVIQETKAPEVAGNWYIKRSGMEVDQGGKMGGKGKYKTKSITYAKEGYPTPKRGRIPKAGNPVISSLSRKTQLTGFDYVIEKPYSYLEDTYKTVIAKTKTKNVYKSLAGPQSRLGKYVQSKSAAQLLNTGAKAAKVAGKALGAFNVVGTAMLAYDAMKAIDEYSDSAMAKSQMKKYKEQGGFSTSDY